MTKDEFLNKWTPWIRYAEWKPPQAMLDAIREQIEKDLDETVDDYVWNATVGDE